MSDEDNTAGGIGYRKPPREHRFKKGQSGNPKGRPIKKPPVNETLAEIVSRIMNEVIVLPNGTEMTFGEAAFRKTISNAIEKGDIKSISKFLTMAPITAGEAIDYRAEVRRKIEKLISGSQSYKENEVDHLSPSI